MVDGVSPDRVWNQKSALKPSETQMDIVDFRLFSPTSAAKSHINIRAYATLDHHPELFIFKGWYDRETRKMQVEKLLEDVD